MRDLDCKYKKLTIMGSIGLALQLQQEKRSLSLHEKAKMRVSYNTVIKEKKKISFSIVTKYQSITCLEDLRIPYWQSFFFSFPAFC